VGSDTRLAGCEQLLSCYLQFRKGNHNGLAEPGISRLPGTASENRLVDGWAYGKHPPG